MAAPNRVCRVDHEFDVQAVPAQQHPAVAPACELDRIGQPGHGGVGLGQQRVGVDLIGHHVGVAAGGQREQLVQQPVRLGDHLGTSRLVIPRGQFVVQRQRVRAVERVEQRTPPGVRGVERVARDGRRHDQLRPRDSRDLGIHARDVNRHLRSRHEVTDPVQEGLVGGRITGAVLAMPRVQRRLELVAAGQRRRDRSCVGVLQLGEDPPEDVVGQVEAGEQFAFDE